MEFIILLGLVLFLLIILFIGYLIAIYNSLVTLKKNIGKVWSNIDVLLKQRHDELIKLLESVKGYMNFEKDLLIQVKQARSSYAQAKTINEKAQADSIMSSTLKSLFAVFENYPELKANEMFNQFRSRITELESEIADRREFYNDSVNVFNSHIQQFPYILFAGKFNSSHFELFKGEETYRQDMQIKFN
jgi:LemA protein